jgi:signal transduction histidine kinase
MTASKLLYLASLITFTFGALTFSVLSLSYWRQRRLRRQPGGGFVFPAFTLACAGAFLINLLLQSVAATGLSLAQSVVTSLLPPLMVHTIYCEEQRRGVWKWLLATFYIVSVVGAVLLGLEDSELIATGWADQLDSLPALMFGTAGALGLAMLVFSKRVLTVGERRHRFWNLVLLTLMLLCGAANLVRPGPFVSLVADYLVLSFFCVTLYYKERLVFFDLLVKRGVFFATALVGLTLFFVIAPRVFEQFPSDWSRPWIGALLLMPFWLMGPWIYGRLGRWIDLVWLRRRFSPAEAERHFVREVQGAVTEEDLRSAAAHSLEEIFQAPADVRFDAADAFPKDAPLKEDGTCMVAYLKQGWAILSARPSAIPYMSDDRRLLESLARTLNVVLENVRFRQERQQQAGREQQLRLLASRAELKALRAQINPHFLFNALNAIAGLIPSQPQLADQTVEQLAEVFRYALSKSDQEWVRLDEEVDFVMAYLGVEQARFGERLQTEMNVDPAAGAIPIPAMTIQPLIENAIKHGVSAVEGRGKVGLRVSLQGELLSVEVSDNGPGFAAGFSLCSAGNGHPASGHGLRNVADRLAGYYGEAAQLKWESGVEGTRVSLKIPCGVLK